MAYRSAIVTGGSGFLGSHVADSLNKNGYDVTIFDLKPSPYLAPTQKMVVGDILNGEQVLDAFQGVDVVYHFAGLADCTKIKEKIGWESEVDIRSGIELTYEYMKKHYSES